MLEEILHDLNLNAAEIEIYTQLLKNGGTTAGILAQKIGMARPTLYDHLQKMSEKGVIEKSLKSGVRYFYPKAPHELNSLLTQKIKHLQHNQAGFEKIIPQLAANFGALVKPKFMVYEGENALKHIFDEILHYRNIETFSFWPVRNMIEILTPEYLSMHNKERIRNNTWIWGIWPERQKIDVKKFPFMGSGKSFCREVRVAPPGIDFELSFWAYADKVAFLSSKREGFGFIVESPELVGTMKTMWKLVWSQSNPLSYNSEFTKKFLSEI